MSRIERLQPGHAHQNWPGLNPTQGGWCSTTLLTKTHKELETKFPLYQSRWHSLVDSFQKLSETSLAHLYRQMYTKRTKTPPLAPLASASPSSANGPKVLAPSLLEFVSGLTKLLENVHWNALLPISPKRNHQTWPELRLKNVLSKSKGKFHGLRIRPSMTN